ncbi:MAG: translation initiation factor IF-2 subunit gamma [Nanoarchaeota archaeon]
MPRPKKQTEEVKTIEIKKTKVEEKSVHKQEFVQPEVNIGTVGQVDNGKTTLVKTLTGKWTDTHSEELKKGITIRIGYADASFYQCLKCKKYTNSPVCPFCKSKETKFLRKVSFVDAPGHETLMATMLSGAAIMDGAILLIAANEKCPQPQTREHLMALEISGIKNIVIAQNKIDLVSDEEALENYKQIKEFIKGTIAESALIIPISAQHNTNIDALIQAIEEAIKTPVRNEKDNPLMFIVRSFDINKPGSKIESLKGGVLGGGLKKGILKLNDEIEIKPGLKIEKEGKLTYKPISAKIISLKSGGDEVKEIKPGGSVGILTMLDPSIVKADQLSGNVLGLKGKLPDVWNSFTLKPFLLKRVVGTKEELNVDPLRKLEPLMLNINSSVTVGIIDDLKKGLAHVNLKLSVCCSKTDRVTISRRFGDRWRLIGYAEIIDK